MNTLSHHIECLLLTHNCVVVPQFGAFLTMECTSNRVEAEELFFPPLRMVRFTPELTDDDGLLVQSVRSVQHLSETEAKRKVQKMVLDLRSQLLADGQADFGTLGIFTQDDDGRMAFSACQAGAITPCYFGLDAFSMPRLASLQAAAHDRRIDAGDDKRDDDDRRHITIRISRKVLRYVASSAAILLMGILFSMSVNETAEKSNQATLMPSQKTEQRSPQPVLMHRNETPAPTATAVSPTLPEKREATTEATTEAMAQAAPAQEVSGGQYCIVLASCISTKNAEKYVADLHERGYANARTLSNKKMNRVILGGYASEDEAYSQKSQLNRQSKEFAEAWVMKL